MKRSHHATFQGGETLLASSLALFKGGGSPKIVMQIQNLMECIQNDFPIFPIFPILPKILPR